MGEGERGRKIEEEKEFEREVNKKERREVLIEILTRL